MDKAVKHARRVGERIAQSQKVRFGAVGIINTLVDFAILNLLAGFFGMPIILANIISTTVAMLVSFGLNKTAVFRSAGNTRRQLALFLSVTLTSIWVIQTGIIVLVHPLLHSMPSTISLNIAKIVGIGGGLIWNYIWYSRVVFPTAIGKQK